MWRDMMFSVEIVFAFTLNGPLHFSNSNNVWPAIISSYSVSYRHVQCKEEVMEGSKEILQSAHTTGPP